MLVSSLFEGRLQEYADVLDCVMNHVGAFALVLAFYAFVRLACGIFAHGLKKVFGCCGMSRAVRLRAAIAFRNSIPAQRAFFEYALLQYAKFSSKRQTDEAFWREVLWNFKSLWSKDDHERLIVEVDNCTCMIGKAFHAAVGRYFAYLDIPAVAGAYSVSSPSDYWKTVVRVREAYVTPMMLLTGLLDRYGEQWERFIAKYVSTASSDMVGGRSIVTRELYGVFAWLLWGPSLEMRWRDGWDGFAQISYGDENNSMPVFFEREGGAAARMYEALLASREDGAFGVLARTDLFLVPRKSFFRSEIGRLSVSSAYFVDKIASASSVSFVSQVRDFEVCNDHRSKKYYCTAYLWLLFERDDPNDSAFHPETSVAFFEHGNLADGDSCRFLTKTLMDKALSHFRMVHDDVSLRDRRYRFVCGLNRELEDAWRVRVGQEAACDGEFAKWLRDSISLDRRHQPGAVFDTIDRFFDGDDAGCVYEEVELGRRQAMADLAVFYAGPYTDAFPKDDERESLENIIQYLRVSRTSADWRFHVTLLKDGRGSVIGGAVFDYFAKTNSVVIEFLVVDPGRRSAGMGSEIVKHVSKLADADARKWSNSGVANIFCEVESPDISEDKSLGHLHFWRRNRFRRLAFSYVQPALGPGKSPVRGLWLLALPLRNAGDEFPSDIVRSVVRDYVFYAMGNEFVDSDADFQAMSHDLGRSPTVRLVPLECEIPG